MPSLCSAVSDDAKEDLALQYGWYEREADRDIAERYLQAFMNTVALLVQQPEMGMVRRFQNSRLKGIRSFQMQGAFRVHLVFYRIEGDVLVVFRVLHGVRDLPRRLTEPHDSEH